MTKDFKKLYWTILIVWGTLTSICSILYALFFDNQTMAPVFWGLSYWTVVIFIFLSILLALGFALGFIVKGFMDDPKKQMGIIIAVVALIVVFGVSYLLASPTNISEDLFEKTGSNYANSRLIGASLYAVYILLFGVILSVLYAEIAKKLK
ncbi:MAG: hypothetical protein LBM25_04320 [Bacteroidales bacterium]|jgi:predicted Abi (CAAX) family protease|nr:hypothetical protein [Bacteroidales bacterium]